MNLLTIILVIAAILTLLSLLLLFLVIGLRIGTDRKLRREEEFRKRAIPVLRSYLIGEAPVEVAAAVLAKNPHQALRLIMEESDADPAIDHERMIPLLREFPFVSQELRALRSRAWERRLHAAEHLGYLCDDITIPSLMNALRDDVLGVRFAAARSLARLGCRDAVEPIVISLDVPGEVSQRRVAEVVASIGGDIGEPILKILGDPQRNESSLAIASRVAGILRIRACIPLMQRLLNHHATDVRINCVRSLASLGDSSSIPQIAGLSDDPSWEVRSAVMAALGRLHASEDIPLLLEGLSDQEWWVRNHAAESLLSLGDKGIFALRDAAENHADGYGRDMSRQILQQHGHLTAMESPL